MAYAGSGSHGSIVFSGVVSLAFARFPHLRVAYTAICGGGLVPKEEWSPFAGTHLRL